MIAIANCNCCDEITECKSYGKIYLCPNCIGKIRFKVVRNDGKMGIIWKESDLGLQVGMKLEGMKIIDIRLFI